jgi:hypothetical protein
MKERNNEGAMLVELRKNGHFRKLRAYRWRWKKKIQSRRANLVCQITPIKRPRIEQIYSTENQIGISGK